MSEIKRISISSSSGYGAVDDAYSEKLSLTPESMRYEYQPILESDYNPSQKWSYRTTSSKFEQLFRVAAENAEKIVNWDDDIIALDVGCISFTLTYADGEKIKREFWAPEDSEVFGDCFFIIRQMIPPCENLPVFLALDNE